MLYLYHSNASQNTLTLKDDDHKYIFRVRRHRVGEIIALRNLEDSLIYKYKIVYMDKKSTQLELKESYTLEIKAFKQLHIGWCVIEPKNIEKALTSLNEIGVSKITFIYCSRSQKSFKLDFKRLNKILLNSSQQSGRSEMMELDTISSLDEFISLYPQTKMLNFSTNKISDNKNNIDTIVVGCEGGFSSDEVEKFNPKDIVSFDTNMVLKSESAIVALSSLVLM